MTRIQFICIAGALVSGMLMGFLGAFALKWMTPVPERIPDSELPPAAVPMAGDAPLFHTVWNPPEEPVLAETSFPDAPAALMVSVCGAVTAPAVYRFKEHQRVQDAIDAAGGLTADADIDDINIAARLMDNSTLYIPFRMYTQQDERALVARRTATAAEMNPGRYTRSGWKGNAPAVSARPGPAQDTTPVPASPLVAAPSSPGRINLNSASLEELQELPGIGPKTAEKIIAYRQERPFERIEDLMEVHGIGDKKMEAVRDLVTVK